MIPGDKTLPTPDPARLQLVQSYGAGRFRISEVEYAGPVLVSPQRCFAWPVQSAAEITPANLAPLTEIDPRIELLIVGCGQRAIFLPPAMREQLRAAGFVCEIMDTGAACRTYNVMLAEGRRVGAALIPLA